MSSSTSSFKLEQLGGTLKNYPAPIILLVLIIAFETIYLLATEPLTGTPWTQPTPDDGMVAAKYALAQSGGQYDIAFVGDSSCLRGVIPDEFARATGTSVVNLCTHKMHSMAGYALLAAKAVREHPELQAIVLVAAPETLAIEAERVIEFGSLGKHLVAYGDEGLELSPGLAGYRHWFASRHAFRSFPESFGGSYRRLVEMLHETGGYLPEPPSNTPVKANYPQSFELAAWQQKWIARLGDELEQRDISLLLALSPIVEKGSNPAFLRSVEQSAEGLARSLGNLKNLRARPPAYPNDAFATHGHLLPEWASRNTRDLAARAATILD